LTEQGDPRGEFIQVQLVLEDDHLSDGERERLRQRERELLDAHGRDWLGPPADLVLGQTAWRQGDQNRLEVARGWLPSLHIPTLTDGLSGALGRNPQARLLQQLTMVTTAPSVRVSRWEDSLLNSPYLCNVCVFQAGEARQDPVEFVGAVDGDYVMGLVA